MSTSITVDDGKTSVVPGSIDTYTIVVSNSGPAAVTGAAISDPLPAAGVTAASWLFAGSTGGGSVTGPASGSGPLATTVNLPANATVTLSFTAQVAPPGGTPVSVTDADTLTPMVDLQVTISDGKTSVVPGTSDTYTIVVTNNGL